MSGMAEMQGAKKPNMREYSLFQLFKQETLADPYPFYKRLRESEPVRWDPFMHSWVVTSYAETVTVLTKYKAERTPTPEQMESMGLSILAPYAELMQRQLLFKDAPSHTRLRALCAAAFTPRRIELFRSASITIANELIDRVQGRESMDLIADFATPFPSILLTVLMGLPVEDRERVKRMASDFSELLGNFEHDPDRLKELMVSLEEMRVYMAEKVSEQRREPREGVISTLLDAVMDGAKLADEEVVANSMLMIAGGLEETTNLIGNGMLSLLQRPQELALLREHPEMLSSAIEELLRFESPTQYTSRIAPDDGELGGKTIRKGDALIVVLAAANRDPARFVDPDRLDLARTDNRHVAFGWASHYCLGAPLTRLAGQIAFGTLLRRLPHLTLITGKPVWRGMAAMRGVTALQVGFNGVAISGIAISDVATSGIAIGGVAINSEVAPVGREG
jgi:pimeloyl-[acyl-carrier protein] synthase